jgi:hypothetical protein
MAVRHPAPARAARSRPRAALQLSRGTRPDYFMRAASWSKRSLTSVLLPPWNRSAPPKRSTPYRTSGVCGPPRPSRRTGACSRVSPVAWCCLPSTSMTTRRWSLNRSRKPTRCLSRGTAPAAPRRAIQAGAQSVTHDQAGLAVPEGSTRPDGCPTFRPESRLTVSRARRPRERASSRRASRPAPAW